MRAARTGSEPATEAAGPPRRPARPEARDAHGGGREEAHALRKRRT
jgi:hypothetical protein